MASTRYGSVLRQVQRLFDRGTVAGLGEGQLLQRFAESADEAAFEALVARHGPMVLGVCRRLLSDPHAVDDAFQATFLVLVKRARSIRDGERLGPWLHGVATRVALRARAQSHRRRQREQVGAEETAVAPRSNDDLDRAELRAVLDEELDRLPARYRDPLVLCYFQGQSHDEAADRLQWPVGTVRSRMARGREQLRGRLARRGVVLPAALVAAVLESEATAAVVPPALLGATVSAGLRVAAGRALAAGAVSAGAVSLSEGVLMSMKMHMLKVSAVGLMALGVAGGGLGAAAMQFGGAGGAVGRPADPDDLPAVRKELERARAEARAARDRMAELQAKVRRLEAQAQPEPAPAAKETAKVAVPGGTTTVTGTVAAPAGGLTGAAINNGGGFGGAPGGFPGQFGGVGGGPGMGGMVGRDNRYIASDLIYVTAAPVGGKISAYSVETGRWSALPVPEGVKATPIMSRDVLALMFQGPEVKQVAVFAARTGRWSTEELREPADKAVPIVSNNMAAYSVGRFAYAFSPESERWGVLELEDGAQPVIAVRQRSVTVEHGGKLHVFSAATGTWASADVGSAP